MAGLALAVGLTVLPLLAQEMGKKDEVAKPTESPSQLVLDQWNDVSRKLIAMVEDFPEDTYDYKLVTSLKAVERKRAETNRKSRPGRKAEKELTAGRGFRRLREGPTR